MIGYALTKTQKEIIQGQKYAPFQCFNCVKDINDIWYTFLTEKDSEIIAETKYNWLLDCLQSEYVPSITKTFLI
jgi:hypothetical protein